MKGVKKKREISDRLPETVKLSSKGYLTYGGLETSLLICSKNSLPTLIKPLEVM